MAPEQARAQPVDGRADLYALGVILYEAATGAPPFAADNMFDVLRLHVEAAPTPPREREPAIPPAFEAVILRALAKDPADRFASADEMREALVVAAAGLPDAALAPLPTPRRIAPTGSGAETQQSLARGETLPSSPPAPRATATPTIQLGRKAFVAILVGAALLGLGGAAIAIVVMRRDESPPARRDEPPPPPPPPHEAVVDPPVAAPPDAPILAAAPVDAALPHRAQPAFTQLPDGAFRVELPSRNPDPFTSYAYVRAQAEAIGKGAVRLSYMTWHHLDPKTGRVTAAIDHAVAEYQFVSSARAARGEPCYVLVDMSPNDLRVAFGDAQHDPSCKRDGVAPPRCNFAQLRAKAEALGLPKDSTAPITLAHNTAEGWQFSAGDFSEYIDDDCP